MRRSRLDIQFGRTLRVGQTWRCGCCRLEWRVRQVHRADCTAELEHQGELREIPFRELRTGWEQVMEAPSPPPPIPGLGRPETLGGKRAVEAA